MELLRLYGQPTVLTPHDHIGLVWIPGRIHVAGRHAAHRMVPVELFKPFQVD